MYQLRMYRWDSDKDKPEYDKPAAEFDSLIDADWAGRWAYTDLYEPRHPSNRRIYPFPVIFSNDKLVKVLFDPYHQDFSIDKKEEALRLMNYFASLTNTNPMTKTISLQQFHDLLEESFAILIDSVIFLSCTSTDDSGCVYRPYYEGEGEDIDLSSVDGDIVIDERGVFFYYNGAPTRIEFLHHKKFSPSEIDKLVNNNKES